MEWVADAELKQLDDFLRGHTAAGSATAVLAALDGFSTIVKVYPRLVDELRSLRAEAQRLRVHVAQESENARRLERELAVARGTIEGLERQVRAA